jgi:hypothetical protein
VQGRGRISLDSALAFLLAGASVWSCGQTVVLEDQIADGGTSSPKDGSSSDSSSSDSSSNDARCFGNPPPLFFNQETPEMVIALDRSSAMSDPFGGDPSQLYSALNALRPEVLRFSAQAPNSQPLIRFAFVDFPDNAPNCNAAPNCCSSDVTPTTSDSAFEAAAVCNPPRDCSQAPQRPTAYALSRAQSFLEIEPQTGQRYVLLVTDGPPSGCSTSGRDPCGDAITQVGSLSNSGSGIKTIIVSIGDGSNASCLLDLASVEGQGAPFFYPASSPNDLAAALATIVSNVALGACRLDLTTMPLDPEQISVKFNDVPVQRDNNNGWSLGGNGGSRVTLNGAVCQQLIQEGTFGLTVSDGCSGGHFGPQTP